MASGPFAAHPLRGRRRSSARAALALEICFTAFRARRLLRSLPLPDVLARLRRRAARADPCAASQTDSHALALHLGHAVRRVLRVIPGDTRCLTQALVLSRLLARRGIASRLVIAVHPHSSFAAHAWVEHGGKAVLPAQPPDFERLAEL